MKNVTPVLRKSDPFYLQVTDFHEEKGYIKNKKKGGKN